MAERKILDACVLHSTLLRAFLVNLSVAGFYDARWSEKILDETISSILQRWSLTEEQTSRIRSTLAHHCPEAVVSGCEHLVELLDLPDQDDRHVLASAIHCEAGAIVTFNLSDFPAPALATFCIRPQHPDQAVLEAIAMDGAGVVEVLERHSQRLNNPPLTVQDLLDRLERAGIPRSVAILRGMMGDL